MPPDLEAKAREPLRALKEQLSDEVHRYLEREVVPRLLESGALDLKRWTGLGAEIREANCETEDDLIREPNAPDPEGGEFTLEEAVVGDLRGRGALMDHAHLTIVAVEVDARGEVPHVQREVSQDGAHVESVWLEEERGWQPAAGAAGRNGQAGGNDLGQGNNQHDPQGHFAVQRGLHHAIA